MRNEMTTSEQIKPLFEMRKRQSKQQSQGLHRQISIHEVYQQEEDRQSKQRERVSSRLRHGQERKPVNVGKGCGQAMDGDGQRLSSGGSSIPGEALIPREPPMRTLCSGDNVAHRNLALIVHERVSSRHHHHFGSHYFEPGAPDLTPWPIAPKNRKTRNRFRHLRGRIGLRRDGGRRDWDRDRPENGAYPSWFAGRKTFLTLGTQLTLAAIADAGCIQQAERTVSFWTTFLRKKPMVGGTEETSIRLQGESRSGEASCKRSACPLGRTINRGFWRRLGSWGRLSDWRRLGITSRRKFDRAHRGGKQMLPEFQTNIPDPLVEDLPKLLSARCM